MRQLLAAALLFVGAGCAAPKPAATSATPPTATAGCIGRTVETCAAALQAAMPADAAAIGAALRQRHLDVNGKFLAGKPYIVSGAVPGRKGRFVLLLYPTADYTITGGEAILQSDPLGAHSEADYEHTGLYEAVMLLLGNRCPQADRIHVYRYFENFVRPRLGTEKTQGKRGIFGSLNTLSVHALDLPFCGVQFSFATDAQWKGDPDNLLNSSGSPNLASSGSTGASRQLSQKPKNTILPATDRRLVMRGWMIPSPRNYADIEVIFGG